MPGPVFRDEVFAKVLERLDRLDREAVQNFFAVMISELEMCRAALAGVREAVVVCDADGKIRFANNAAHNLIGLPEPVPVGDALVKYLRELSAEIFTLEQGSTHLELDVSYPIKRRIKVLATRMVGGNLLLVFDERVLSQVEMQELVAQERIQGVVSLAAGVAHEIGNPLNSMRIHLQLLKRDLPAARGKKAVAMHKRVDVALDEIRRLDSILHQFLKAVRPASPQLRPASLNAVVAATIESMGAELASRDISVEFEQDKNLPPVLLDPDQIHQVLYNLMRNAIQASPNHSTLHIKTFLKAGYVAVEISDEGCGMSPEVMARVFDPYFTTKETGTGLGLYVVRRIVREHGGSIDVRSSPGEGTSITIMLHSHEGKNLLAPPGENHNTGA